MTDRLGDIQKGVELVSLFIKNKKVPETLCLELDDSGIITLGIVLTEDHETKTMYLEIIDPKEQFHDKGNTVISPSTALKLIKERIYREDIQTTLPYLSNKFKETLLGLEEFMT